ncbi:hypothetical protein DRQ09_07920 [candidate division KSB1 bacterium]|nr:MAG: hypothetical protein DRQ09_07920 [candidate division KSB1 bacterium]
MKNKTKSNLFLPVGIGFFGMSLPLFIAIFFSTDLIEKLCNLIAGIVMFIIGFIIIRQGKKMEN